MDLDILSDADKTLGELFTFENSLEIKIGDSDYFTTGIATYKTLIDYFRVLFFNIFIFLLL